MTVHVQGLTEALAGIAKLAKLSTSERDRAFSAGLRKVGRGVRQDAIAKVREGYAISARARSQGILQPRFPNGSSVEIWADRKPRTAFQWAFKPASYRSRQTRRGMKNVSWQIRQGQTVTSPTAFTAKGRPWIRPRGRRRPLNVVRGPSMHGIVRGPTLRQPLEMAVAMRVGSDFVPEFQRVIARWLS